MEMKPDLGALLNMAGVVRKLRDMSLVGTEAEERALFDRLNARQLAAMVTVFRFTWKSLPIISECRARPRRFWCPVWCGVDC